MSVYNIQMNQNGAILKTSKTAKESFLVMPDYIKLEKASYPRMIVNPIEPWTEEDSPPEDYGKNVIDDTFEEDWYYTFYCDTTRNSSKNNGSSEEPFTNFYTAVSKVKKFFEYICCNDTPVRLMVKGSIQLKGRTHTRDESFDGLNFIIDCTEADFYHKAPDYYEDNHGTTLGITNAYIYNLKISSISDIGQYPLYLDWLRLYNLTPEVGTDIGSCVISKINKPINDRYSNYYNEAIRFHNCHIKNVNNTDFLCSLDVQSYSHRISYMTECVLNTTQDFNNILMIDSTINNKQQSGYNSSAVFVNCFFYRSKVFLVCGCKIYTTYFYTTEIKSTLDLTRGYLEGSSYLHYFELKNTCIFDSEIKNTVKVPLNGPRPSGFYDQYAIKADWDNKMSSIKNSSIVMEGTLVNRPNDNCSCIGYGAVMYSSVRDHNLFIVNCELSETVISPLPDYCDWMQGECEKLWL
jgi:hypothetical protein